MNINYCFRVKLITVILSHFLIQIYVWTDFLTTKNIPRLIAAMVALYLSAVTVIPAFLLSYDSERFKILSPVKQIIY
ncbi:TPA: hypothetical protein G8D40_004134 [Salmonella enterica]|uniref:Uncharacterized protein n=1 Tax=Escherichia coli TaxID=562 RepID=A0A1V3VH36_ECOLX|nr:hypothetical protein AN203_21915 [Escherichia coli]EAP8484093.1 hypothetical protein [Salmonella enterica]EBF3783144.1 hypothetical protein [Salmonella enterica subsp. enterica serovar Reading]EBH3604999.1 hypothetical protein [Salmonella enterica subsp. enterica serovar Schwarzengrund]EBS1032487.1 hypothetical protein [Salmonella enterica subsp. enterica serovar Java]EBV0366121.1 hypothetical protein [Salmonella enterica subsp. enterica serovar Virchow]EBV7458586.1 hypothetical protein [S